MASHLFLHRGAVTPTNADIPPDPTIESELAISGADDVVDMANLSRKRTGIDGIVYISTKMGKHGPRVNYFEQTGPGRSSFSVSISDRPEIEANSLPDHVVSKMGALVRQWVEINKDDLLKYWNEGAYMDDEAVDALKAGLKKV